MPKKICVLMLTVLLITALPGCQSDTLIDQYSDEVLLASGPILKSEKERIGTPEISNGDREKLVEGNMEFALDLYQQLVEDEGNFMFSPYSISSALAMTYAGANGTTAEQMASTLHFELPETKLHQGFNNLDQTLVKGSDTSEDTDDQDGLLHIVNAIWGQENYEFRKSFLDTLTEHYGAGLRIVDYRSEPEAARITINDWVSRETEEKITELIPPGVITKETRLVLTNALYFKAAWEKPFSKGSIGLRPFHLLTGNEIEVYMMTQTNTFPYIERSEYQAVELPYDGQGISMVIILPPEGKFTEFEGNLDFSRLRNILSGLDDERVRLSIPKFKLESDFQLDKALSLMGMPLAFDWIKADFTRMTTEKDEPLYIGSVLHKSFIDVDEKGTEAAAATAVVMMTGAAPGSKPDEPKIMTVDRPFIFLIRDIETDTILFLGRVLDPGE
jgi:serpin B